MNSEKMEGKHASFDVVKNIDGGHDNFGSPTQGTNVPKGKGKRVSGGEITLEVLQKLFHLPMKDAAAKIGIGATVFKQVCRKHNISKWPYRQLNALNESLEKVKAVAGKAMDVNEQEEYTRTVRSLEEGIAKLSTRSQLQHHCRHVQHWWRIVVMMTPHDPQHRSRRESGRSMILFIHPYMVCRQRICVLLMVRIQIRRVWRIPSKQTARQDLC